MPFKQIVSKELAQLFGVLSHPMRIRIIEELSGGERDVNTLVQLLDLSQSGVSQHLSLLRAHRLILERKEGRKVFYHLRDHSLAAWALEALRYVGPHQSEFEEFVSAVEKARGVWSQKHDQTV